MTTETLESNAIPHADWRTPGCDNGANMSGKYNGAHAMKKETFHIAILFPCGCHSLNLCGIDATECVPEAITYFGTIHPKHTLFCCCTKWWQILANRICCSHHGKYLAWGGLIEFRV